MKQFVTAPGKPVEQTQSMSSMYTPKRFERAMDTAPSSHGDCEPWTVDPTTLLVD